MGVKINNAILASPKRTAVVNDITILANEFGAPKSTPPSDLSGARRWLYQAIDALLS